MKSGMEPVAQPLTSRSQRKAGRKQKGGPNKKVPFGLSSEDDSIADFDESEWTPQDSAYGAACPVCGFIPKHVRRMIEFSLIAIMVLGFVYLLVTTSIHITNDRNQGTKSNSTSLSDYNGGQIALDDDMYVEYNRNQNDDDLYAADDDGSNHNYNADDDVSNRGNNDDLVYDDDDYYNDDGGGGRKRFRGRL
jgi:hypothetical protein